VTDTETTAFERRVYYLECPGEWGMPCWAGSREVTGVGQVEEGAQGKRGLEPLLWFPCEGVGGAEEARWNKLRNV